jgi:acyl dehydratase
MPELNKAVIGKEYPPMELTLDGKMSKYYALATNDPNPWYIDETRPGGIICPPLYAVFYAGGANAGVFMDQDIGPLGFYAVLVHGEQDIVWHRPIKPGETVVSWGKIADVVDKGTGELLVVESKSKLKSTGELVATLRFGFFVRGYGKLQKGEKKEVDTGLKPVAREIVISEKMRVLPGQSYIYAEPSGDHNPIHKDNEFAKKVGLGGIILQGLCTMAFVQKAVVDTACAGDPTRLQRLAVRFSKPVRPGDDLLTEGWETGKAPGKTIYGLETKNRAGEPVIKNAVAEVS